MFLLEEERIAWAKVIPLLPVAIQKDLAEVLAREQKDLASLRSAYLAKAQRAINAAV